MAVAEQDGEMSGFAYATLHRERAAYRWATDVTVYVEPAYHRRRIGHALYTPLFELLARQGFHVACAGVTLPNQPAWGCTSRSGSYRSASTGASGSSPAPGGTSAGGSWS